MLSTVIVIAHIVAALGALATGSLMIAFGHAPRMRWSMAIYSSLWCVLFGTGLILGWQRAGVSITETLSAAGFGCVLLGAYASAANERVAHSRRRLPQLCGLASFGLLVLATVHQAAPMSEIHMAWWIAVLLSALPAGALAAGMLRAQPVRAH